MSDEERLSRLEHRLEVLEGLVRQLAAGKVPSTDSPRAPSAPPTQAPPPASAAPASAPQPAYHGLMPSPAEALRTRYSAPGATPRRTPLLNEQWLGQRGLLAVGVIFVILAAGYLLKLSFDRGWVSPLVRCIGGTVVGLGIGGLGWRLHGRGVRMYGAALIGCGAAIMYLAVWAAARLYEFLSPAPAIAALALVSLGLAALALAIDVEALGAAAALGAFFAPIVVGKEAGSVNLLLLYLGAMGAGLGTVSARRHWRIAALVVALAYFGVASSGILTHAEPAALYLYGILGGAAGLFVGLREGWPEARLLSFAGGWTVLGVADDAARAHWPTLLGGMVLTAPAWWRALTSATVWPDRRAVEPPGRPSLGESFYFYISVPLLGFALHTIAPGRFDATPGLVPLLLALPYLAIGLSRPNREPFTLVAAGALVVASLMQWPGLEATWALLALAHLWALSDHGFKRTDGARYALASFTIGLWHLLLVDLPMRPSNEAAFTGAWALTLWLSLETAVALAVGLLRDVESLTRIGARARPVLWVLAGLILLFGVTGELMRAFQLSDLQRITAHLAGGLSVSAWWICCAAACFVAGFRRRIRALRLAGFGVAGLALLKVVLVDLSRLDALYRVGSAFILGVVSLAVAYAYHRTVVRE